jgi:hypothetical protein
MPTNNKDERTIWTAQDVQQQVAAGQPAGQQGFGQAGAYGQAGVPGATTAVTPITGMADTPQSAEWRNVQATGKAKTDYQNILRAQPLAYQSRYGQTMQDVLNGILGRPDFRYDVNVDPLYQQIKDNYVRQGRQAMMDVQGQSAALTGGYGNTYGVLASQQAYQDQLGNLSDRIPELYQLAYNRYKDKDTMDRSNLAALQGLDDTEYQRYQYDIQQYETKLQDAYKKYRASLGSGKKKYTYDQIKQFLEDNLSFAQLTGGDINNFVDAQVAAGTMPKEIGDIIKVTTSTVWDSQKSQAESDDLNSRIRSYATNPDGTGSQTPEDKKPK